MRHRKSGRQLNRNSSHRQAMFRNMAGSLVRHEIIKTTLPKAKELRRVVEPLITLAKTDSVANRRLAFARTRDNEIVAKLFNELGPRFASRAGDGRYEADHHARRTGRTRQTFWCDTAGQRRSAVLIPPNSTPDAALPYPAYRTVRILP